MKIHADKIESAPPHALRASDVRLILKTVPPDWIEGLAEVRLANSMEYYSPYAFFSRYDGCLTIYSRCGTIEQVLVAVLSALAADSLGMNRGIGRRRSKAEVRRLGELIQPLVEELLPAMQSQRKLSPEAHLPWHPTPFPNDEA